MNWIPLIWWMEASWYWCKGRRMVLYNKLVNTGWTMHVSPVTVWEKHKLSLLLMVGERSQGTLDTQGRWRKTRASWKGITSQHWTWPFSVSNQGEETHAGDVGAGCREKPQELFLQWETNLSEKKELVTFSMFWQDSLWGLGQGLLQLLLSAWIMRGRLSR